MTSNGAGTADRSALEGVARSSKHSKHTIIALVEDRPGVLNRVSSKWRQRNFNIESLTVGPSETPGLSRMTFVVDASNTDVDQVIKQLYKVIEVAKITDITHSEAIMRELALIKVKATASTRGSIIEICEMFRANIIDVAQDSLVIETTGTEDKIDAMFEMLRTYGIKELVRTGRVAMTRGATTVSFVEEGVA
ncbi:MAG: acetolactate synthase small subunit [Dehalococcoidia bacterium]|nr:acetolactate synthase small subunit [Dehalococcoidia bacterium]